MTKLVHPSSTENASKLSLLNWGRALTALILQQISLALGSLSMLHTILYA